MKKVFLFLVTTMLFAANVNAQEVHGVESKMVCTYECNPNGSWDNWKYGGEDKHPWFAYEFTNLNSIPVSVEVELYHKEIVKRGQDPFSHLYDYKVIATKSFVLKSGESYIFKNGEYGIGRYSYNDYSGYVSYQDYYIKYKAYKLL